MKVTHTELEGLIIIEPEFHGDERGYFIESFNRRNWQNAIINAPDFVQDNESCSTLNVLRGLHFQAPPYEQGKLVRVVKGKVLDVAVDIRKKSPTYGKHFKAILSGENKKQIYIPPGFAHGFLTLEDQTIFSYKCTSYYNKESEGGILWKDDSLGINWGTNKPIVSDKDAVLPKFNKFVSPF
ncbi:MAG: dTDP-4-dehydrorhamnose 3,5-epimerase [Brumimicrobium sp.]|nr:dTDP-4-dehydrorhamnose 3,5-epimerase [Brumimicrobium sp.]